MKINGNLKSNSFPKSSANQTFKMDISEVLPKLSEMILRKTKKKG